MQAKPHFHLVVIWLELFRSFTLFKTNLKGLATNIKILNLFITDTKLMKWAPKCIFVFMTCAKTMINMVLLIWNILLYLTSYFVSQKMDMPQEFGCCRHHQDEQKKHIFSFVYSKFISYMNSKICLSQADFLLHLNETSFQHFKSANISHKK